MNILMWVHTFDGKRFPFRPSLNQKKLWTGKQIFSLSISIGVGACETDEIHVWDNEVTDISPGDTKVIIEQR
jgi:hypothetical protein